MTPVLLDICDREGILVIDENRLSGINSEHLRLLENMIKRDRNHPSVILWSDGNEEWGMENAVEGRRVAEAMREYTRLLDPTRPSTMANAGGWEMVKGLDVVGINYIVQNDVDNRKKYNPTWKFVGTEETSGCGTRGIYFNDPDSCHMPSINRVYGEKSVDNVIERGWQFYADRDWEAGLFYWTGFDYRGEPNPLEYPAHESEFGILDYCGFWKDEAWYLKAWWTDEPTLHIFPHWNLQGHEGEKIEIILPDPQVELTSTRINHDDVKKHVPLFRSNFSDKELADYSLQGRKAIVNDIPKMGVVKMAQESATRMLVPMLQQMGYEESNITITFRKDFSEKDVLSIIKVNIEGK